VHSSSRESDVNEAEFEATLIRDGFGEVLRRDMPAGFPDEDHHHPFDVRALVLAGEITLTADGVAHTYCEGEVFAMPAGRPHRETVGSAGVRYLIGRKHAT